MLCLHILVGEGKLDVGSGSIGNGTSSVSVPHAVTSSTTIDSNVDIVAQNSKGEWISALAVIGSNQQVYMQSYLCYQYC